MTEKKKVRIGGGRGKGRENHEREEREGRESWM